MNQEQKLIFFLGYLKATLENICLIASKDNEVDLFNLLVEFEQMFNQEMAEIFI